MKGKEEQDNEGLGGDLQSLQSRPFQNYMKLDSIGWFERETAQNVVSMN